MSLSLVDCAASQFYFPGTDIHSDCSTFRRVSKSDSQSLDVWETVHLLQVGIMDTMLYLLFSYYEETHRFNEFSTIQTEFGKNVSKYIFRFFNMYFIILSIAVMSVLQMLS